MTVPAIPCLFDAGGEIVRAGRGIKLPGPIPAGAYGISGNRLVDSQGNPFEIRGANTSVRVTTGWNYVFESNNVNGLPEYYSDADLSAAGYNTTAFGGLNGMTWDDTTTTERIDAALAMGWNCVRVNHAMWSSDNTSITPELSKTRLETGIRRLTAAGIVVILEAHDLTGLNPVWGDADESSIRTFWTDFCTRYADDPMVWANPYNEPHTSSSSMQPWIDFHTNLVQQMVTDGYADKPLILDLPRWAQGIDNLAEGSLDSALDTMKVAYPHILLGWHAYGHADRSKAWGDNTRQDHIDQAKAAVARGHAIHIGEFAGSHHYDDPNINYTASHVAANFVIDDMRTQVPEVNGAFWWHSHHGAEFALTLDRYPFWEQPTRQGQPLPAGLNTYGDRWRTWCLA